MQDAAEALRQLPPQATTAQIAAACARAYAGGLLAEQAGGALAQSGVIASGAQAADVLDHLRRALDSAATTSGEYPATWPATFAKMFASGAFGEPIAAEFAAAITRGSIAELDYRLDLLYIAAGNDATDSRPVVTNQDLNLLAKITRDLEELIQMVRKRQRKRRMPSRKGGAE